MRATLGALLAAAAFAGLASASFGGPVTASPTIPDCDAQGFMPRIVTLACADGNYGLAGMRWSNWGAATAIGIGSARANDCTPNCAYGHFHTYPLTATASRLRTCLDGENQYTLLVLHYPGRRPAPRGKEETWRFPCDAPSHGPALAVRALGGGRIEITGSGWQRSAPCERRVALGLAGSTDTIPFARPAIDANNGFHLVWAAPKRRVVVTARQPCYASSTGLRTYESAVAVRVR